jgi:phosphomannomutase
MSYNILKRFLRSSRSQEDIYHLLNGIKFSLKRFSYCSKINLAQLVSCLCRISNTENVINFRIEMDLNSDQAENLEEIDVQRGAAYS